MDKFEAMRFFSIVPYGYQIRGYEVVAEPGSYVAAHSVVSRHLTATLEDAEKLKEKLAQIEADKRNLEI